MPGTRYRLQKHPPSQMESASHLPGQAKSSLSVLPDSEFPQPIAADNVSPVKRIANFENDIEQLPSLGLTARNRAATLANLPREK